jgi:hypothetical protein
VTREPSTPGWSALNARCRPAVIQFTAPGRIGIIVRKLCLGDRQQRGSDCRCPVNAALASPGCNVKSGTYWSYHIRTVSSMPSTVVQVLEYAGDLAKAFDEIHRVLRDGGRFVNLSTNWSSCAWHTENTERMRRALNDWSAHEAHRDLRTILGGDSARRDCSFSASGQSRSSIHHSAKIASAIGSPE